MVNESSGAKPGRAVNAEHTHAPTPVPGEYLYAPVALTGKRIAGRGFANGTPGERKAQLP